MLAGKSFSHSKGRGGVHPDRKPELYKTEMCRNWTEMGHCRYGRKCRFAHGADEVRSIQRHVRYKTEVCRTYHLTGTCLYGVRCTFIHDEYRGDTQSDDTTNSSISSGSSDHGQLDLLINDVDEKMGRDSPIGTNASLCVERHPAPYMARPDFSYMTRNDPSPLAAHPQVPTYVKTKRLAAFASICADMEPSLDSHPARVDRVLHDSSSTPFLGIQTHNSFPDSNPFATSYTQRLAW